MAVDKSKPETVSNVVMTLLQTPVVVFTKAGTTTEVVCEKM